MSKRLEQMRRNIRKLVTFIDEAKRHDGQT